MDAPPLGRNQNEPGKEFVISHKIPHGFCAIVTKKEKDEGFCLTNMHNSDTLREYGIFEKVLLTEVEALGDARVNTIEKKVILKVLMNFSH